MKVCVCCKSVCVRAYCIAFSSRTLTRFRYQCSTNRIEAEVWPHATPFSSVRKLVFHPFFVRTHHFSGDGVCVCLYAFARHNTQMLRLYISDQVCRIVVYSIRTSNFTELMVCVHTQQLQPKSI